MLKNVSFLIVDDQPPIRLIVAEILKAAGAKSVRMASDGAAALGQFIQDPADMVITDLAMPGMDGFELIRRLRTEGLSPNPYVPILVTSGWTDLRSVARARDAGANDFLAKPLSPANLLVRITTIIAQDRPFVRTSDFFGPCRRRHPDAEGEHIGRRCTDTPLDEPEDDDDLRVRERSHPDGDRLGQ